MESGGSKGSGQPEPIGRPLGSGTAPQSGQGPAVIIGEKASESPPPAPAPIPAPAPAPRRRAGIALFAPLFTGLLLGAAWFFIGGLPFSDHDEHGFAEITAAGERAQPSAVALPGGDVYFHYEERGVGENQSLDQPPGLRVEIRPVSGGARSRPLPVEDVPSFLFSANVNGTEWEPVGKVDAPEGRYSVTAKAERAGFGRVAIGEPPINPFGPPIVGAILIVALGAGVSALLVARSRAV